MLTLAAWNNTETANTLYFVHAASKRAVICVHVTVSKCSGSHCWWSNLSSPLHAQQCLQPLEERAVALMPPLLLLGYFPPFFSPFFLL